MKNILTLVLFSILCMAADAQTVQRLDEFRSVMSDSNVVMSISYEVIMKHAPSVLNSGTVKGDAELRIQGNMYSMNGSGLFIMCDGKSVRILDPVAKEVIYEPVSNDFSDGGYLMNPTMLFSRMDEAFRLEKMTADESSYIYLLIAKEPCGIENCRLDFSRATGNVSYAEFVMSDGNVVKVNVTSFKTADLLPLSDYSLPDPSSYGSDWIVTDLR